MTPHTVHYQNAPVDPTDYPSISERFKLPYEVVLRCIEAMQQTGEVPVTSFTGTARSRVNELAASLTLGPAEDETEVFYNAADEPDEPIANSEPSAGEERDEIVDHAASALMQSFSDPKGCFLISEDGVCRVNPDNPPTLQDSYTAISHIMKLKELGSVVEDKSSWLFGSAVAALEDLFGEDFNLGQICELSEKNYNTAYQAVNVFRAFPKRYKVSFSHHQEAFFAKIPATALRPDPQETRNLILFKAESHQLGAKQVRALCSVAKLMEDDTVIRNIRSPQMAKDLIDTYAANRVQWIVYDDGETVRFTDTTGTVPIGKLVIDTKNWTMRFDGGKPIEIKKVSNPSINVPQ